MFAWEKTDVHGETLIKKFCLDAVKVISSRIPTGTLLFTNS